MDLKVIFIVSKLQFLGVQIRGGIKFCLFVYMFFLVFFLFDGLLFEL